ncbi:MAG: response regulator [Gammaproteobacteria bacterium]
MSQSNILIIDDNRDMADGLGMILEDEGYQVTLAYNGRDGIGIFNAGHFDMVLVDFKLPDMNGVAVLRQLHQKDPQVRVIVITGYHVEQLLAEAIDDGTVEVLRKPLEIGPVIHILDRIQKENIILIVDDDPDAANRVTAQLTDQGIKTLLAGNAREAVAGVISGPVEVLVLDLRLPVTYGLEVYQELGQLGHTVKTLIVTGYADDESGTVDSLRSTAVTGCLFKPFRPEQMLRVVKQIMAH